MTAMMGGGTIAGGSPSINYMSPSSGMSPISSSFGSGYSQNTGLGMSIGGGISDIFGGIMANQSYSTEAGALKSQANEAIRKAEFDAQAKANEVRQFAGNQQEEYASSGVTLAGTPAQVIADTQKRGQQEVDAIARRGAFQAQLFRTQAMQAQNAGRNSILGGIFKAGTSIASNFI